jgi:hypothetical protein
MNPGVASSSIKLAGWSGIAAFLLAVPGTILLGFLKPGYDPISSTISELGERGSTLFLPAAALFIAIGLCEIVFAISLYLRSRPRKAALFGSILLMVNGLFDYVGSGVFPIDSGGGFESASGRIHFIVSVIGMSVMPLPAFLYWRSFRAEGRASWAKAARLASFIIAFAAALFIVAFAAERFVGLAQRILDFTYFSWILAAGIVMARDGPSA